MRADRQREAELGEGDVQRGDTEDREEIDEGRFSDGTQSTILRLCEL
jgi:hypothetical protein